MRKLKGFFKLFLSFKCPHCSSDAKHACPVCKGETGLFWQFKVWKKFVKLVNSK